MEPTSYNQSDEDEAAGFIPDEEIPDSEGLSVSERFFRTLDHHQFRAMSPGKQILYLQLLRWSFGCGKDAIEASRLQMSEWTGLAWDTIKKYVPELIEIDHVLKIARPATSVNPAMYEVLWLPMSRPATSDTDTRPEMIACYIDQLDKDDKKECHRLASILSKDERRRLQSEISFELHLLGIPWNYLLIKKLITWKHLVQSPYRHTLEKKHPEWFSRPSS